MWKSWIHNCMLKWAFKALQHSQSFKIRSIHKCLRKANIRKSLITSYLRAWTEHMIQWEMTLFIHLKVLRKKKGISFRRWKMEDYNLYFYFSYRIFLSFLYASDNSFSNCKEVGLFPLSIFNQKNIFPPKSQENFLIQTSRLHGNLKKYYLLLITEWKNIHIFSICNM